MFVLTYVLPPKDGAAYGKSMVSEPQTSREVAFNIAEIAFDKEN